MFFVGHISIALILSYFIVRRFQVRNVSISLVLFLSILPDIDILFRLVGIDVAHRSITHSIIIFIIVLLIFILKYRVRSIIIYFIAYFSHSAIGDIIVGPSNLLSPFGIFFLNSGIYYMKSGHIFVEGLLLITMAIIVVSQYLCYRKRKMFPFKYSKKLDPVFYPMVIAAIAISAIYLLDQFQELKIPYSFSSLFQSYNYFNIVLVLHSICLATVLAMWIISRHTIRISHGLKCVGIDERTNRKMDKQSRNRNSSLN